MDGVCAGAGVAAATDCLLGTPYCAGSDCCDSCSSITTPAACCEICHLSSTCVAWQLDPAAAANSQCQLFNTRPAPQRPAGASTAAAQSGCQSGSSSGGGADILSDGGSCVQQPKLAALPYCDPGRSIDARVQDLVGRMTLLEKVSQLSTMIGYNSDSARRTRGVPRLGIPPLYFGECLHGAGAGDGEFWCVGDGADRVCPTSFPSPSGLGTAFNDSLWRLAAAAVGSEVRAMRNLGKSGAGLVCWGPTINLLRDPRWWKPWAVKSLSADLNINVLKSCYNHMLARLD
jgi:hypothetical protein